jgi:hypothetical protein
MSVATQIITLTDDVAPVASNVPADFTIECGLEYALDAPTFSDNCAEELQLDSWTEVSDGNCPKVITYYWSATDNCNNQTVVSTVVTIEDTTPPSLQIPADYLAECDQELAFEGGYAYDVCGGEIEVLVSEETVAGNCPQNYQIIRSFTATDACGNAASGVQTITVTDTTAPEFDYQNSTAGLEIECDEVIPYVEPLASDNCGEVTFSYEDMDYLSDGCYSIVLRVFTATDECSNSSEYFQYITIVDTTAPVFEAFEIESDRPCDDYNGIYVSATDNCNEVSYDYEDEFVSGGCQGRIIRTYFASDLCGNQSSTQQIITLTDDVAPVASNVPAGFTIECGLEYFLNAPSFSDNCAEELQLDSWTESSDGICPQVITHYWSATDNCNNQTVVSTSVTLIDTTAPEFTYVPSSTEISCEQVIALESAEANDTCDNNVEVSVSEEVIEGDCPNSYTLVRTFTASDDCDNTATATQYVYVYDQTAPEFTFVPEGGYFSCEDGITYGEAIAQDNCGDATVTFEDSVEPICANSFAVVRTWTATDACGHTTTATSTYLQYDNTAPTFDQEVADYSVECYGDVVIPVLTATDNCGVATVTPSVSEDVDACGNGVVVVEYDAIDECGNGSKLTLVITVSDETAPELSEYPADLVVECGTEAPAAPELTATDNCDSSVNVEFEEYFFGDAPAEGSIADCNILTPVRPAGNPCGYPVDWAMALFGMPSSHRWYQVSEGQLIQYPNGTIHVIATLHNAYNPANGFNVDVEFVNGQDWAAWSSQSFLTSFKADCGGEAINHPNWMYYLLNGANSTLTGFGGYSGSVLNVAHAPANNYFGFQLGDGANNYNGADNGFGGWFSYSGLFLVNGQQLTGGNVTGAADFAFELDCCPDYELVRCWTAIDCSGNVTQHCQTIAWSDNANGNPLQPVEEDLTSRKPMASLVSVSPNPAVDQANFVVKSSVNENALLEVYDMAGAKVAVLINTRLAAGQEYRVSMDVSNLANGIYMYRFMNGSDSEVGRILIGK